MRMVVPNQSELNPFLPFKSLDISESKYGKVSYLRYIISDFACSIFCFVCIITSSNDFPKRLHLPITIRDRYDTTRLLGLCRIRPHLHLTSLRRTRDRGRPCYTATVHSGQVQLVPSYNTHVFVHTRISLIFPLVFLSFSFYALRACCQSLVTVIELNKPQHFSVPINLSASQSLWNVAHLVSGPEVSQSLARSDLSLISPPSSSSLLQLQLPSIVRRLPPFGTHSRFPDWIGLACRHSSAPEGPPISLHSLSKLSEGLTFPRLVGLSTDLSSHLDLSRQVRSRLSLPGPRAQDVSN
jgi:hypothetical protein